MLNRRSLLKRGAVAGSGFLGMLGLDGLAAFADTVSMQQSMRDMKSGAKRARPEATPNGWLRIKTIQTCSAESKRDRVDIRKMPSVGPLKERKR